MKGFAPLKVCVPDSLCTPEAFHAQDAAGFVLPFLLSNAGD